MIERYTLPEMGAIWQLHNKFQKWLDVEIAVCEVHAEDGTIPTEALKEIKERAAFTVERINQIEKVTDHDVIAFTTNLAENIGDSARFVHYGLTSSDVVDTANGLLLTEACDLLIEKVDGLLEVLKRRAFEFKDTPQIGRTHGIHAEPTAFGMTFALWYSEMQRNRERLVKAREQISVGKISGAVGAFAHLAPDVEERVCERLGLKPADISTQVIQRDRYAEFLCTLGVIASTLDKIGLNVRHWQRTEVREAQEYFAPGQKGSSAMPHKRNPILTENLTGLARIVRSAVTPALENVALWHERDISHSSVERMIGPDATVTLDFALNRLAGTIEKLVVYPQNMLDHMNNFGGIHDAQRVLLYLTQNDISREDAYRIVQRNAMRVWKSYGIDPDNPDSPAELDAVEKEAQEHDNRFFFFMSKDEGLMEILSVEKLSKLLDEDSISYHTKNVDRIFERIFGK